MREYLLQLKTQAVELWQKMTRIQRLVIGCSAGLLFVVLILLARGAATPDYGALFTLRDNQEAGQVIEKLKEMKIPFQVSDNKGGLDGGVTIMVPSKDITQTRLELAGENLPTGGVVGFENFDNTKFGETDTDRRARYLRALQGELTRTIEGMAEVTQARVHIVLPEPSIFMDDQTNATAAIMLRLRPNSSLAEGQVRGLIKLVSNSVEGLKEENVTIVDMAGNILSENVAGPADSKALTMNQIELQKQYQKEIQGSVQTMLERVVGLGKAVVRVQLELDFDKIQQKVQDFGDVSTRSRQITEKTTRTTNTSTNAPAAPGTDSNIPGYEAGGETGSSESSETERIDNNEIDTFEEIKEVAPGSVKRLSVAVVIDKEIDTKQQTDIENLVKSAIGFDGTRGDQISLAGIPFNTEYQDEMNKQIAAAEKFQMLLYGGVAAAALLVIAVVAVIALKRRKASAEIPVMDELKVGPFRVNEVTADDGIQEKELTSEEREMHRIKERVEKVAKDQPDDVAQLIRTWLAQE